MKRNKKQGTVKIKVTPESRGMVAPYTIVELSTKEKNPVEKAENIEQSRCRLGAFKEWIFVGEKI